MLLTTNISLAQSQQATVIASSGIVRESNNFQSDIIKSLSRGTTVSIIEEKQDWYLVQSKEDVIEGWMYKDIIVFNNHKQSSIKKGIITARVINVRAAATTQSERITQLTNGTEITILDTVNEWYHIQLNTGVKAYVHSDYVKIVPTYPVGRILKGNVNLLDKPSSDGQKVGTLKENNTIYIKGYENEWYNVVTENFLEGWVPSEFIELQINITNPVNRSGSRTHTLSDIKSISEKYLGKRYVYGGNGPNNFDCSGFVSYILNTYYKDYLQEKGINLPRVSRQQATVGTVVKRDQLRVGDLVFFNGSRGTINHVGIYIGNNEFIHASSGGNMAVITSSLNAENYRRRYATAVRL